MMSLMTATDLRNLLERAQSWPEEAQNELVTIAREIESGLRSGDYSRQELRIIDDAMASIDRGETASEAEISAAFGKFRRG